MPGSEDTRNFLLARARARGLELHVVEDLAHVCVHLI